MYKNNCKTFKKFDILYIRYKRFAFNLAWKCTKITKNINKKPWK